MKNTVQYKGTYTDTHGTTELTIINDYDTLLFIIDNVKFESELFEEFLLIDKSSYTERQLARFSLVNWLIPNTGEIETYLINFLFNFTIPMTIIDIANEVELQIDLNVEYSFGKFSSEIKEGLDNELLKLSLTINGQSFFGSNGDYIEYALDQIDKQFDKKYQFKNCYGCIYGNYSFYGQNFFGSLLCNVNQKEKYLKARTRGDFLQLEDDATRFLQEIYFCDKYEIRKSKRTVEPDND